jgi:hypothetical protein
VWNRKRLSALACEGSYGGMNDETRYSLYCYVRACFGRARFRGRRACRRWRRSVGAGVTVGSDRDHDRDRNTTVIKKEEPREQTTVIKKEHEEPEKTVIKERN